MFWTSAVSALVCGIIVSVQCASPPFWIPGLQATSPMYDTVTPPTRDKIITSNLREKKFLNVTPGEDVARYFETCPMFEGPLHVTCQQTEHSCSNRCGQFMSKAGKTGFSLDVCSCDAFCEVYGDCCWDFQNKCPSESEEFGRNYAHMRNVDVSCENNAAIIEGPTQLTGGINSKQSIVLSLQTGGLTFRNYQTFQYYFNKSLRSNESLEEKNERFGHEYDEDNFVFWTKEYLFSLPVYEMTSLKMAVESGQLMDNLNEMAVVNQQPSDQTLRTCNRRVILMCFNGGDLNHDEADEEDEYESKGDNSSNEARDNNEFDDDDDDANDEEDDYDDAAANDGGNDADEYDFGAEEGNDFENGENGKADGDYWVNDGGQYDIRLCDSLDRSLTLVSLSSVCEIYSYSRRGTGNNPVRIPSSTVGGIQEEPITQTVRKELSPLSSMDIGIPQGQLIGENRKCYTYWNQRHPFRDNQHSFRITFAVDFKDKERKLKVFAVQNEVSLRWQQVRCTSRKDEDCDLVFDCKPGYLLIEGECRRPKTLVVKILGRDDERDALMSVLHGVAYVITHQSEGDGLQVTGNEALMETREIDADGESMLRISYEMTLTQYDMDPLTEVATTRYILPVTSRVSDYLTATYDHNMAAAPFDDVIICLGTDTGSDEFNHVDSDEDVTNVSGVFCDSVMGFGSDPKNQDGDETGNDNAQETQRFTTTSQGNAVSEGSHYFMGVLVAFLSLLEQIPRCMRCPY